MASGVLSAWVPGRPQQKEWSFKGILWPLRSFLHGYQGDLNRMNGVTFHFLYELGSIMRASKNIIRHIEEPTDVTYLKGLSSE